MTPEERKAAVIAMAASIVWNHMQHDIMHKFSAEEDAETAFAGLEKFMNTHEMVFYKP